MKNTKITNSILKRSTVDIPTLQTEFSLSYKEAKEIIDEMTAAGKLRFSEGITYKVIPEKPTPPPAPPVGRRENQSAYLAFRRRLAAEAEQDEEDDEPSTPAPYEIPPSKTMMYFRLKRIFSEGFSNCINLNIGDGEAEIKLKNGKTLAAELSGENSFYISDRGETLKDKNFEKSAVDAIIADYPEVAEEDGVIKSAANRDNPVMALLNLFAAIERISKL